MFSAIEIRGLLAGVLVIAASIAPAAQADQPVETSMARLQQANAWDRSRAVEAGMMAARHITQLTLPVPVPGSVAQPGLENRQCSRPDDNTLRAIVPVATDHGSHATGVVYDDNRVLTAAHAVQGGSHFFVRIGEDFRSADLVMVDHDNDLAVLAVDTRAITPLQLAGVLPARHQPVWAVGYPRAQGMITTTGILQQYDEGALHASASIDSGQSGGGLLSCNNGVWEMLGMLRGYGAYLQNDHYVKVPNHSVSVAAATINEFLRHYQ